MGIPAEYRGRMYDWTMALIRRNGQMGSLEERVGYAHAIVEMKNVIAGLVEERRSAPRDDLISDLIVSAHADGATFSELELLSTIIILLVGGAENTRNTLLAAMVHLLHDPALLARVKADPSLTTRLIDETLRFDTPGTALLRVVPRATQLGGVDIPAGSLAMMRLDSANRDDALFALPDRFDIDRENLRRHLSFGLGAHFCIGSRLAQMQAVQSIAAIVARFDNLQILAEKSDLRPHPSAVIRSIRELHITFDQD